MRTDEIIRRWRPGRLAAALAVMLASGCAGESGPPRLPVSGKVTLDGKPLPSGTITFLPTGKGEAASGPIADGSFAVEPVRGSGPGEIQGRDRLRAGDGQAGQEPRRPDRDDRGGPQPDPRAV